MVIFNLADKIARCDYKMGKTYEVDITWFHHPSNIFVRPANIREAEMQKLEEAGDRMEEDEIIKGKVVIYYSNTVMKLIRGQIYEIISNADEEKCAIYAMDYGFYDISVSFWNIYNTRFDEIISPLATSCRIGNCFPIENTSVWPMSTVNIMKIIFSEPTVNILVRIPTANFLWIDLYTKNNINVGKWMIEHHLAASVIFYRRQGAIDTPRRSRSSAVQRLIF